MANERTFLAWARTALAFISFGGGLNMFISYRMYKWFNNNLIFSLLTPLFIAPIVCIPLFSLMFLEKSSILSKMVGIDENEENDSSLLDLMDEIEF